jgi:hypothetical protein
MDRRQPLPGQTRCTFIVGIEHHPGMPFGFFPALLSAVRIDGYDRATKRSSQLPHGQFPGSGKDFALHRTGRVVTEHPGVLGDQPGSGQINQPSRQRGTCAGQPPGEGNRQICPPRRAELRHCLRQRYFCRGCVAHSCGAAVIQHADLLVASSRSGRDLSDSGQLSGGRPRRDPPEASRDSGQVMIGQGRRRDGPEQRSQTRSWSQSLGDPASYLAGVQRSALTFQPGISLAGVQRSAPTF